MFDIKKSNIRLVNIVEDETGGQIELHLADAPTVEDAQDYLVASVHVAWKSDEKISLDKIKYQALEYLRTVLDNEMQPISDRLRRP